MPITPYGSNARPPIFWDIHGEELSPDPNPTGWEWQHFDGYPVTLGFVDENSARQFAIAVNYGYLPERKGLEEFDSTGNPTEDIAWNIRLPELAKIEVKQIPALIERTCAKVQSLLCSDISEFSGAVFRMRVLVPCKQQQGIYLIEANAGDARGYYASISPDAKSTGQKLDFKSYNNNLHNIDAKTTNAESQRIKNKKFPQPVSAPNSGSCLRVGGFLQPTRGFADMQFVAKGFSLQVELITRTPEFIPFTAEGRQVHLLSSDGLELLSEEEVQKIIQTELLVDQITDEDGILNLEEIAKNLIAVARKKGETDDIGITMVELTDKLPDHPILMCLLDGHCNRKVATRVFYNLAAFFNEEINATLTEEQNIKMLANHSELTFIKKCLQFSDMLYQSHQVVESFVLTTAARDFLQKCVQEPTEAKRFEQTLTPIVHSFLHQCCQDGKKTKQQFADDFLQMCHQTGEIEPFKHGFLQKWSQEVKETKQTGQLQSNDVQAGFLANLAKFAYEKVVTPIKEKIFGKDFLHMSEQHVKTLQQQVETLNTSTDRAKAFMLQARQQFRQQKEKYYVQRIFNMMEQAHQISERLLKLDDLNYIEAVRIMLQRMNYVLCSMMKVEPQYRDDHLNFAENLIQGANLAKTTEQLEWWYLAQTPHSKAAVTFKQQEAKSAIALIAVLPTPIFTHKENINDTEGWQYRDNPHGTREPSYRNFYENLRDFSSVLRNYANLQNPSQAAVEEMVKLTKEALTLVDIQKTPVRKATRDYRHKNEVDAQMNSAKDNPQSWASSYMVVRKH